MAAAADGRGEEVGGTMGTLQVRRRTVQDPPHKCPPPTSPRPASQQHPCGHRQCFCTGTTTLAHAVQQWVGAASPPRPPTDWQHLSSHSCRAALSYN